MKVRYLVCFALAQLGASCESQSRKASSAALQAEVTRETSAVCELAQRRGAHVLVEFSADWCQDCRRLEAIKAEPPLMDELAHFQEFRIDVDHERYDALKDAFSVRNIARWLVLAPSNCQAPLTEWPKLADRVLEPTANQAITNEALTTWLQKFR